MMISAHSGGPLAVLEDIHLTLGGAAGPVNILRGISLSIAAGETVSLVGPSGSGKSSLMMVLSGLERPSRGRVWIDGQELGPLDEDARARLRRARIGIVFQAFHLIPTMTALENVAIPLELAGRHDAFDAAAAALLAIGLGERLRHYPAQLSGGEQQRVAIARAIVNKPAILLADEPTGNLDTENSKAVLQVLCDLNSRLGQTILMITHNPEAAAYGHRTVQMRDGRVVS
jgi:putative ABC transport system ATP-binding protein